MRLTSLALVALAALAACGENPAGPTVPTGQEFQLRSGESVAVEGARLGIRFELVASDSRCPADAVCITLGDAEAVFTIAEAGRPVASLTLHTHPGEGQRATVGEWTLTLTRLDPYPYSGRAISPYDYQARLRVDRLAGS